jgi:hypothetical protein
MATCHPDRKAYALGLCNACYQRRRYAADPGLRERLIARARARQKANHEAYITQKMNYNRKQRETARYERWAAPRRAALNPQNQVQQEEKRREEKKVRQEKTARRLAKLREILYKRPPVPSQTHWKEKEKTAQKWAASNRAKMARKLSALTARGISLAQAATRLGITMKAARRYMFPEQHQESV